MNPIRLDLNGDNAQIRSSGELVYDGPRKLRGDGLAKEIVAALAVHSIGLEVPDAEDCKTLDELLDKLRDAGVPIEVHDNPTDTAPPAVPPPTAAATSSDLPSNTGTDVPAQPNDSSTQGSDSGKKWW
jgi:hypothetical protein